MRKTDLIEQLKTLGFTDEEADIVLERYDLSVVQKHMQKPDLLAWDIIRHYASEAVRRSESDTTDKRYEELKQHLIADYGFSSVEAERLLVLGHIYENLEMYPGIMAKRTNDDILLEAFQGIALRGSKWEADDRKIMKAFDILTGN